MPRRRTRSPARLFFILPHGPQISIENAERQAAARIRIRAPTAARRAAHFSRGGVSWVVIEVIIPYPPFVLVTMVGLASSRVVRVCPPLLTVRLEDRSPSLEGSCWGVSSFDAKAISTTHWQRECQAAPGLLNRRMSHKGIITP